MLQFFFFFFLNVIDWEKAFVNVSIKVWMWFCDCKQADLTCFMHNAEQCPLRIIYMSINKTHNGKAPPPTLLSWSRGLSFPTRVPRITLPLHWVMSTNKELQQEDIKRFYSLSYQLYYSILKPNWMIPCFCLSSNIWPVMGLSHFLLYTVWDSDHNRSWVRSTRKRRRSMKVVLLGWKATDLNWSWYSSCTPFVMDIQY